MPTHTRIRMFNTKETYPNQALNNDLCQAVRGPANTVYVRGQAGTDFAGNLIGLGDPRAAGGQAMKNVEQLLKEAEATSHIVKTTTYLIDPRYREPVYQEVGKWLKGVFPISTGVVVSALSRSRSG